MASSSRGLIPFNQHGLTLVEVLVALVITSLMAMIGYQSLVAAANSSESVGEAADQLVAYQLTMSALEDDISEFRARGITDNYGEQRAAIEGGIDREVLLELSRGGRYRSPRQLATSLERVRYRIADGTLWRDSWYQLDRVLAEPSTERELLTGIEEIEFNFLVNQNGRIVPYDAWDSNVAGRLNIDRPEAIEVTILTAALGEVKLLVNLN
ncbi:type II secretion system minor pseudopilin GspJ [uncultured Umboniibacter sp.]|uniref:type II secretion system minor pseudopilin GspJ n=1 Tax=uncultured Umboniibacter sp. TaxID=1798917 RepID=UPI002625FDA2|nr:type II secretion system minor pseudopilin GspJ [uncultured Umboniibacter sp.]